VKLQWPGMNTVRTAGTYRSPRQRLYWPGFHVCFRVPRGCEVDAGTGYWVVRPLNGMPSATFSLRTASAIEVPAWWNEGWEDEGVTLSPTADRRIRLGIHSRFFAAQPPSRVGYKVTLYDVLGNGASGRVSGPADRAADLDLLLAQIADCVQFVHLEPLDEGQVRKAVLALLNLDADTKADVLLFIDRHYYLMRLEVMQTVDAITRQLVNDKEAAAEKAMILSDALKEARALVDAGEWDRYLAPLRPGSARPTAS
jgi:hypothetical protein